MVMKDVGRKMDMPMAASTSDVYYPRLSLDLNDFPEFNKVGKEVTLMVKGCIKSVSHSEDGGTIDLEIYECGTKKEGGNKADQSYSMLKGGRS